MGYFSDTYKVIFGCCTPSRAQRINPAQENRPAQESKPAQENKPAQKKIAPENVPARDVAVSESMKAQLEQMQIASNHIKTIFLPEPQVPPYLGGMGQRNTDVTIPGPYTARCVIVGDIAEIGDRNFLVSDSFSPCVPIIVFATDKTWLAHSNGFSAADKVNSVATPSRNCEIRIISKLGNARQAGIANSIAKSMHKLSPEIVNVETSSMIGVVVSAISKTILVYNQYESTPRKKSQA